MPLAKWHPIEYGTNVELAIRSSRSATPSNSAREAAVIDVRVIANEVLSRAEILGIEITNMAINKIVYFVHCDFMLEDGEPLVSAKIEAWQHGPVFRELYQEFKKWGDRPVKGPATRVNPLSGEVEEASAVFGSAERKRLDELIDRYVRFSAAHLRALSHVTGGPWDQVWTHSGRVNPGMRISNDLIKETYQRETRQ